VSKLKRVSSLSSSKLEAVVAPKLKVVKPSGFSKLEVELVRLVVPELKRLSFLKFSKLGLRLVRRIIVESARLLILI
jgi:hypothetical protein